MALQFPVSLAGKRGGEASICQYQGECEILDPATTYIFNANCGIIKQSNATSLPQSWGANKNAYGIYIGTNLTTWGNSLFRNNPRLTSIYIPKESTACGIYGFYGATDLHTVTFGGQHHAIGSYSFRYCNNLTRANFCNLSPPGGFIGGSYGTFVDCPNLTEVHVPVNGWVGTNSWLGLTVIRDLPEATPQANATNAYDSAGNYTFSKTGNLATNSGKGNSNTTSIEISPTVSSIGNDVFSYCPNLEGDLVFPGTLTTLGKLFARQGANFDSITFEEGITSIPLQLFLQYAGTKSIDIALPSTITSVANEAFNSSTNNAWGQLYLNEGLLTMGEQIFKYGATIGINQTLVLPSTLTSIGRWNFRGTRFNRIEIKAGIAPAINSATFDNMSYVADNSIHVPSNATGYAASYSGFTVVYDLPAV